MESFRKLGLIDPILKVIEESKFESPSEVQEKSIPHILAGKDVIGGSATGSGKTLAFAAGIIQNCERGKGIQALVLVPTRELAEQVTKVMRKFSHYKPFEVVDVYGGLSINPQIDKLRHADIVVGTPGRILDHIDRNTINLTKVKILVLDEADRMLDMGFIDDVEKIIRYCPRERQTLLFSATIGGRLSDLSHRYMHDPIKISVESYVDPTKLTQIYYNVADNMKFSLLVHLLNNERSGLVMVFCNSRKNVDFVAKNLNLNGIDSMPIHGGYSQQKRSAVMDKFHGEKVYVLVCTDVAARGLDIKGVSHVYNYDIPKDSKQYIHRVGRTARAGEEGKAINILASRDYDNFTHVLEDHDIIVTKEDVPQFERAKMKIPQQSYGHGGHGFNRGRGGQQGHHGGRNFRRR
jgi:ATP-dependent RNA helicase DeaD